MGKSWMSNYAKERREGRLAKKVIVERMLKEGATKAEIAEATGYSKGSVGCVIMEIKHEQMTEEERLNEQNLIRIKRSLPNLPKVEHLGKTYLDITDLFLSSEWENVNDDI